ncbi:MAG TPA: hypothetical protein DGF36_05395 [Alteromonas sp.]|nr:hypothetical protein [Alteromonas sp.]HCL11237.1 hypothetical protein [Alteromonas sp.]HCV17541.1 hypothetical protein [Alteromonas sp.]|tara:strand:+ start:816 stop:1268 length:453 start_codon:yes stop_codon:yes gene_type:complete
MSKKFWILVIAAFVVINEILVDWLLAIFVGDYGVAEGFIDVTRYLTVDSLLFAAGFRAIPYGALLLVGLTTRLKHTIPGKLALWLALLAIAAIHFWGYWAMQYSFYTPDYTSSTSELELIFVPIHALWIGAITCWVGFVIVNRGIRKLQR